MIDEIPIIGVTRWTVEGLATKDFANPEGANTAPRRLHSLAGVWIRQTGE
jgi:hypothetical protein